MLTEKRLLDSAMDPSFLQQVVNQATAGQHTNGAVRSFYGLLSVELLLQGLPDISRRVDYGAPDPELPL
jgi:hypothetical protein